MLVSLAMVGLGWAFVAHSSGGEHGEHSFLGVNGSPVARLVSRMVTERGDDAFHGGATHDIKFQPQTGAGKVVARVVGERGVSGVGGRNDGGESAKAAYSRDVGRWVAAARALDPGNFDALLTHCHYLLEGGFAVEVGGEDSDGEEYRGDQGVQVSQKADNSQKVADAVREFLRTSPLNDKTAWYSAAAAVQMLHEVDPVHFGVRRSSQLIRLNSLMRMLIEGGDRCPVVWGGEDDVQASRQFAVALLHNLEEATRDGAGGGKNTLFKSTDRP